MASVDTHPSPAPESAYLVRGQVSPEAIVRSLQAFLPTRRRPIARQRFTVLDTFDGRVRRAGTRLTQSGGDGGTTLAWQPRGGGNLLTMRLPQPVRFAWDLPDSPLQQALTSTIGVRRLLAQADAEGHGSLLEMLDDQGKTVARLRIESGRARPAMSDETWQPLPTVITLTGMRGYEDVYRRLVPIIESRPGVESCADGFHGVMLRLVGAPQGTDVAAPAVDVAPSVRADVGARHIHRALLGTLIANEPGLRANLDTEFLHDFRVAVRRTRSLLRQIRHVFPPDAVEHFSIEFSWLGRLTGGPRDLDVLVLGLRQHSADIPRDDIEMLTSLLAPMQEREHQALVAALDGDRYRRLLSEWAAFLERPPSSGTEVCNAERPLAELVSQRAWRLCRRISRAAGALDAHTAAEQLHEVRIDAKKLRYLIDVTPAFYDATDFECVLGALKKLQRVLGHFNDSHVQQERLLDYGRVLGGAPGREGALLAVGRLAEQRRQRCEQLRGQVAAALARFHGPEARSACRRAFKRHRPGRAGR
jgi:CHAD domain-containing protein